MKKELLFALVLAGCTPAPIAMDAEYSPFTDTITYYNGSENNPQVVKHEEEHQKRANEMGRIEWGILYTFDATFRCDEEIDANTVAGYPDPTDHPYCAK
jgi:hypothetical protein